MQNTIIPRRKLRVAHVVTRMGAGGPPLVVLSLIRGLKEHGYDCLLVTGTCAGQEGDMSYLLNQSDAVSWVPGMSRNVSIRHDIAALVTLYRTFRKYKPDIVHTHTTKAGCLGRLAAVAAGVPVVVHTFHGLVFTNYFDWPIPWLIRLTERFLAEITDRICVLAPEQKTDLTDRFHIARPDKVEIIPLGIDLTEFRNLSRPTDSPLLTVGWLGRFVPVKNVGLLVSLAEEVIRKTDKIRFLVAGDGPEAPLIAAAMERLGPSRFHWVGWKQNVAEVISECDVLLQTSLNEGTPVALIQGMAAGRPFISTAVGGVPSMLRGTGRCVTPGARWHDNGVLVEPTAEAFAETLLEFARRPELVISAGSAASTVAIRFDLAASVDLVSALYGHLQTGMALWPLGHAVNSR